MEATLVFPDQLYLHNPAIDKNRKVYLLQDSLYFNDFQYPIKFHKQKILLHLLSTKNYCELLLSKGFDCSLIEYRNINQSFYSQFFNTNNIKKIHYCDLNDYTLSQRIIEGSTKEDVANIIYDSPGFLLKKEKVNSIFNKNKKHSMANFYQNQRKYFNILIDKEGKPIGGKWSFDEENRKKLPRGIELPKNLKFSYNKNDFSYALNIVKEHFEDNPGDISTFNYPITHSQALKSFKYFLEKKIHLFGDYEDAISKNDTFIFHSILTPYLNIGLITPKEVIEITLEYAKKNDVRLNSLEGFIRQVIGWREFIRGVYNKDGVKQRKSNFWNFKNNLPDSFYSASTGIEPVDDSINKVLNNAYCHHIERLMILGNFMVLIEVNPRQVYKWFMEFFIDGYDWVMVPNVFGMSQFADGGIMSTKPYISGSNYLLKMSNYKKGDWCDIWDSLFWRFINKNNDFFSRNFRMKMLLSIYSKKSNEEKERLEKVSKSFLKKIHG